MCLLKIDNKRTWMQGLLFGCPMGVPLDTCHLEKYRALEINKRMDVINNMDNDELNAILEKHDKCLCKKGMAGMRINRLKSVQD